MTSKFALVIANTEYQDVSFAKLTAPGKDAEEFAQILRELATFDDVQVLLNEGEGKTRRSIARFFADRKRDDLLLLYFSGHGVRNEQGQLFLAANDTEISILEASGIPADFVTSAMNYSRSQRQLLILDCCNSGAFAHGSKSASGVGKSMGIATAFEGSGFGRVVLTATDATQYAWEGEKVIGETQKSVFTHFLIEGLKGDADSNGDGCIDIDELYEYAYEQVVRRTPKQTPGKWSYKQQGDILLRENLKPREVKPAPLPPELLEFLSHPNSGVRRAAVQDLIDLLNGKHSGLARAAEDKLREIVISDDSLNLRQTASDALTAHGLSVEQLTKLEITKIAPVLEQEMPLPKVSDSAKHSGGQSNWQILALAGRWKPKLDAVMPKLRLVSRVMGIVLVVALLIWASSSLIKKFPSLGAATALTQSTKTNVPKPTLTLAPLVSKYAPGSAINGRDGMTLLYVPTGDFTMGSDINNPDEKPAHTVYINGFWIDKTEVTNQMYSKCVQDGECNPPSSMKSNVRDNYYGHPQFKHYPVIYVSWHDAKAYCEWAGRRLPTEAEWEKAARGTDNRQYPWGADDPTNLFLNYNGIVRDTTLVDSYSRGASFYGALNMAGNVWEWVADWYDSVYYKSSPASNPLGPDAGIYKVRRGGSWDDYLGGDDVRTTYRDKGAPGSSFFNNVGIRCARSE